MVDVNLCYFRVVRYNQITVEKILEGCTHYFRKTSERMPRVCPQAGGTEIHRRTVQERCIRGARGSLLEGLSYRGKNEAGRGEKTRPAAGPSA